MSASDEPTTTREPISTVNAFFAGVAAGVRADTKLGPIAAGDYDRRSAFFWLHVGISLQADQVTDEEAQALYIQGAGLRAPSRQGFELTFLLPDAGDEDVEGGHAEMGWILRDVAERVQDGVPQGDVFTSRRRVVGQFRNHEDI